MAGRRRRRSSDADAWRLGVVVFAALLVVAIAVTAARFWFITLPVIGGSVVLYRRRRGRSHDRAVSQHRQYLIEQSCLPAVDAMSGTQFEIYVAELLEHDGHVDVRVVGGRGDGGVDVVSREPSGRFVAVQCKRQFQPVAVGVVRELIGAVAHDYAGRHGVLVTTTYLTRPAAELAQRGGISVVDRDQLARWISQVRASLAQAAAAPRSDAL